MASGSASFISSIEDTVLLLLMTLSVCVYIFIYNKEEFCTLGLQHHCFLIKK